MGRSITVAIVVAGILVSGGCGQGFDYGGTWIGERKSVIDPTADPVVAKVLQKVQIQIKPDLTFVFLDGGRPREGQFRRAGDHGEFDVRKNMGQPLQRENGEMLKLHDGFKVYPGKDPDSLIFDDNGAEKVVLTRSEKPLDAR